MAKSIQCYIKFDPIPGVPGILEPRYVREVPHEEGGGFDRIIAKGKKITLQGFDGQGRRIL